MTNQSPNPKSQNKFIQALFIVILLAISNLSLVIAPVMAQDIPLGDIEGTGKFQESGTALTQLGTFISTMINVITVVAGLAFLLYFAIGGLKWITSSGEKSKAEEAKTELTQAAIGLIVVVVSYFIVGIVGGVVGIDILNPGKLLGIQ